MSAVTTQASIDASLEREINAACLAIGAEPDLTKAVELFHVMRKLVARRSAAQVDRMERAKGLDKRATI